ncbi:hypothetical protein TNCV_2754861 [Trichonephila clavipes]|nr:hypothetical protein TNCV_2754861 [Trichonephila clavipes]
MKLNLTYNSTVIKKCCISNSLDGTEDDYLFMEESNSDGENDIDFDDVPEDITEDEYADFSCYPTMKVHKSVGWAWVLSAKLNPSTGLHRQSSGISPLGVKITCGNWYRLYDATLKSDTSFWGIVHVCKGTDHNREPSTIIRQPTRGGCQLRYHPRHLSMVPNYEVRRQYPLCCFIVLRNRQVAMHIKGRRVKRNR